MKYLKTKNNVYLLSSIILFLFLILFDNGYLSLTIGLGQISITLALLFVLGLLFPFDYFKNVTLKYVTSPFLYLLTAIFLIFGASFLFSGKKRFALGMFAGYSESCICFKNNAIYTLTYGNLLGKSRLHIGRYKEQDSLLILDKKVSIGRYDFNDTLINEKYKVLNVLINDENNKPYGSLNKYKTCEDVAKGG